MAVEASFVMDPCPDLETLAALVDGNLSPGECDQVQTHLDSCAKCFELVSSIIASLIIVPDPPDSDRS
jgi:anti-sigma factor RsiW